MAKTELDWDTRLIDLFSKNERKLKLYHLDVNKKKVLVNLFDVDIFSEKMMISNKFRDTYPFSFLKCKHCLAHGERNTIHLKF